MQIHHRENVMNIEYIIRISNFLYFEVRKVRGGIRNFTPFFGFTFKVDGVLMSSSFISWQL